jgi:hypothetical protein
MKKDKTFEDRCVCVCVCVCVYHSHSRYGQYLPKLTINVRSFLGDKIKKNDMSGTCSTYGREERRVQVCGGETLGK